MPSLRQFGLIAQGLLQYLALSYAKKIWTRFPSWVRTMNPDGVPSERIVALTLQQSLPDFLCRLPQTDILAKFLVGKIDWARCPTYQLAA